MRTQKETHDLSYKLRVRLVLSYRGWSHSISPAVQGSTAAGRACCARCSTGCSMPGRPPPTASSTSSVPATSPPGPAPTSSSARWCAFSPSPGGTPQTQQACQPWWCVRAAKPDCAFLGGRAGRADCAFVGRSTRWGRRWTHRPRPLSRRSAVARRRDCHFADTSSPSLLKHLLNEEGGASE